MIGEFGTQPQSLPALKKQEFETWIKASSSSNDLVIIEENRKSINIKKNICQFLICDKYKHLTNVPFYWAFIKLCLLCILFNTSNVLAEECDQVDINYGKITICHVPGGNVCNEHTLCVSQYATKGPDNHFPGAHGGDYYGKCITESPVLIAQNPEDVNQQGPFYYSNGCPIPCQ